MPRFVICNNPPRPVVPVAQFTTSVPYWRPVCAISRIERRCWRTNASWPLTVSWPPLPHDTAVKGPPNPALEPTARPGVSWGRAAAQRARYADWTETITGFSERACSEGGTMRRLLL